MSHIIHIKRVESKSDWKQFIDMPWLIYKNDSHWVPPLKIAVKDLLDFNKNPFFKHAYLAAFLAFQDGKVVGRIAGVIDDNHNRYHSEQTGFFGFYESIDSQEVALALMTEVESWLKVKGMNLMRGPMNPSTNHECGLLVEGFNDAPNVMMTYNPPYYLKLFENLGLTKSKDLLAYEINGDSKFSERLLAHSERLKKRGSVVIREVDMKNFDREINLILDIYNDAWEKNWGFVPMNEEEFRHMAKDMKAILDPRLLLIAEVKGVPAGFALTLPDANQAIHKVKNGKLLPFGIFKLLWNLKGPGKKKTINRCRILTLGMKKAYRDSGVGALLYTEYLHRGPSLGYFTGEASWILEDNIQMNKALVGMAAVKTKVYRILDKTL